MHQLYRGSHHFVHGSYFAIAAALDHGFLRIMPIALLILLIVGLILKEEKVI